MNTTHYSYEFKINTREIRIYVDFLMKIVEMLDTTPVGLDVRWYPVIDGIGGYGPTAFVTFIESYVAFDTWPEEDYGFLSIVSCKDFNKKKLEKLIRDFWGIKKIKTYKVFNHS